LALKGAFAAAAGGATVAAPALGAARSFFSPLEQLVAEGELDLAFVHPPIAREDLTTRTLYAEPLVLSVPAGWPVPSEQGQQLCSCDSGPTPEWDSAG
jgi:DNA-binding transcriptional LysR family regulator